MRERKPVFEERCSCGAEFRVWVTPTDSLGNAVDYWRRTHVCPNRRPPK
jgi:hypothetical protein